MIDDRLLIKEDLFSLSLILSSSLILLLIVDDWSNTFGCLCIMNERPNATVKNCQALIICLVVFFFYYQSRYSASERVWHHSENEYGDLWVHERGGVRCISFAEPKETEVYQSCIMLDDPKRLVFNYTKMALGDCI